MRRVRNETCVARNNDERWKLIFECRGTVEEGKCDDNIFNRYMYTMYVHSCLP